VFPNFCNERRNFEDKNFWRSEMLNPLALAQIGLWCQFWPQFPPRKILQTKGMKKKIRQNYLFLSHDELKKNKPEQTSKVKNKQNKTKLTFPLRI